MPTTLLIEPTELANFLGQPDWVIVDCRFDLARPQWGESAYAQGHIPGAVYAHLDRDLSGPVGPHTGRHPLPSPEQLAATFGRWGIDGAASGPAASGGRTQVVAYDQANGAYAARLWWLLRWAGHREVAVLNGGFAAWQRAGLPLSTDQAARPAREFVATPVDGALVTAAELERLVADGVLADERAALVDARGADRFAGQNETLDPVAGHIPGARNHPFTGNLDANGRFLAAQELRGRWLQTLGRAPPAEAIAMCGSGVTACHNLLAMELAGLSGARLYPGSWSEWIRDPKRPIARGPA
jgi:thiosulfate/3-mercaptopyruvate sulfurtransferase